jgi:hypothetical protein
MASAISIVAVDAGRVRSVADAQARVAKKPSKKRPRKLKDGLLNASIRRDSGHLLAV